jgi:hypothetical protein
MDFGLARIDGDAYAVRAAFPPLARQHLKRLPDYLLVNHLADLTEHLTQVHGECSRQTRR